MTKFWDFYQVKWTGGNGQTRYGLVDHGEKSQKLFIKGQVIVEDAIIPKFYKLSTKELTPLNGYPTELDKYVKAEHEKAEAASELLPPGPQIGKIFALGVADGYATYVITKVTARTITVEWRGFCPDRWTDTVLGWGGAFPRRVIENIVGRDDKLRKFFGKEKVKRLTKDNIKELL